MNTSAFTVVRTTRTAIEADLLIAVLRSHGLHPLDLQTTSNFTLGGDDNSYNVEVPTAEAKEAKEFLQALDNPTHILPPDPSQKSPGHRPGKSNP